MTVWKWSQTPASNNLADSTINWREGQGPSTLNNAARGMMAAVRKWWDDISGNIATGGTATAITITTNQVLTALTDGFHVTARITTTSGVDPTLTLDSLTAKAIRYKTATAIPDGALVAGSTHKFTYDSGDDCWYVHGWFAGNMRTTENPDLVAIEALAGTTGGLTKTAANTWALDNFTTAIIFEKDNNGNTLTTGIMGDSQVPFACTITGVTVLGDQSGSCVVDIWKDSYANYPPTDADSITSATPPTISTATKATDTTLTSWTTSISAGDTLRYNLDSVTSFTRLTIILRVKRFA